MLIIGVDFHPEFQQIAWVDTDTGEFQEQRLQHREQAEAFYRALGAAGQFFAFMSPPLQKIVGLVYRANSSAGRHILQLAILSNGTAMQSVVGAASGLLWC